jgi:hypothetical protein
MAENDPEHRRRLGTLGIGILIGLAVAFLIFFVLITANAS